MKSRSFDGVCYGVQKNRKRKHRKKGEPMPKRIMPLTDLQVKNAIPKEKNYKLSDGAGLYLLITPSYTIKENSLTKLFRKIILPPC
jgi:hypothetical protein